MKNFAWIAAAVLLIAAVSFFVVSNAATPEPLSRTSTQDEGRGPTTAQRLQPHDAAALPSWNADRPLTTGDSRRSITNDTIDELRQRIEQLTTNHAEEIAARTATIADLTTRLDEAVAEATALRERLHSGARQYAQRDKKVHDWAGATVYADVIATVPDVTEEQAADVLEYLEQNATRFREITSVQRRRKSASEGGMTTFDMESGVARRVYPDEIPDNTLEFLTAKDEYFAFFRATLDPHQFAVFERSPDRFDWSLISD